MEIVCWSRDGSTPRTRNPQGASTESSPPAGLARAAGTWPRRVELPAARCDDSRAASRTADAGGNVGYGGPLDIARSIGEEKESGVVSMARQWQMQGEGASRTPICRRSSSDCLCSS